MVITPSLYYLFSPLLMGIIGLVADKFKVPRARDAVAILISLWGLISVWTIYNSGVAVGEILIFSIGGDPPLGACFEIDAMSIYVALSATLLSFLVTVYSFNYMEHDTRLTEYYALLSALTVGMVGVAFAGDMFTMFLFWEMMGISSYSLVSFRKDSPGPIEAGFKYMIMGSVGSTILFFGMAMLYGMAGTVNFAQMSSVLRDGPMNIWLYLILALLIVGFGVKSAIVPMHTWLPDAHPEAPSTISAMLSGMLIETALYALIRVIYVLFEPSIFSTTMAVLAFITMSLGNIMALRQNDLKRMLAYSSIAQVGYMLIGVSTGLTYGLLGTFLHIFNHSLMKGMAFLAIGSIVHETGTRDINGIKGISRMMPFTTIAVIVSFLGLGGVPGTNGFISKFILFNASIGAGFSLLAVFGVLNSALSMAYYLRVIMTMLNSDVAEGLEAKEAPFLMLGVTLFISLLIIILGLYPSPIVNLASEASTSLIDGLSNYIGAVI